MPVHNVGQHTEPPMVQRVNGVGGVMLDLSVLYILEVRRQNRILTFVLRLALLCNRVSKLAK